MCAIQRGDEPNVMLNTFNKCVFPNDLRMVGRYSFNYTTTKNNILTSMKFPLRNLIFERIKQAGNITDAELLNSLKKEDIQVTDDTFNKVLLDLEIFGLIRVSWIEKHKRRIEVSVRDLKIDYIDSVD